MQYTKPVASPASSTSTIDQQEVIYEESAMAMAAAAAASVTMVPAMPAIIPPAPKGRPPAGASRASPRKRPKLYNISYKLTPWKSLNHHFQRYTDVKLRPEKRVTMSELSNELSQRNGWKAHYLVSQLSDLIQNETSTRERIQTLMDLFTQQSAKLVINLANNCHKLPEQYAALLQSQRSYGKDDFDPDLIVAKLDDLLKGEIQRSKLFDDQLRQCRDSILSITSENCEKVPKLTTKFNKRFQL